MVDFNYTVFHTQMDIWSDALHSMLEARMQYMLAVVIGLPLPLLGCLAYCRDVSKDSRISPSFMITAPRFSL